MKAYDIIQQLFNVVPLYTDYFTDSIVITEITSSGLVANVEASTHGLETGNYAHISGTLVPNDLTVLASANGIASATTANSHDLTMPSRGTVNVEIIDANESEYNGSHELLSQDNRKNFTYAITGTPATPATGSPKLLEDLKYGYNGWHQITKIDDDNFTYAIRKVLGSPAYGTPKCKVNPRISGSFSIRRAIASYTKQNTNKLWAFVILGNTVANKDRDTETDQIYAPGKGAEFRQLVIQPFSVYVFMPKVANNDGREERDLADDLRLFFCRSLLKFQVPTQFSGKSYSGTVYSGDNFYDDETAYYVHEFVFETTEEITYKDTIDFGKGVAFRDIDIDYISSFSDNIFMTDKIDLDDEQL